MLAAVENWIIAGIALAVFIGLQLLRARSFVSGARARELLDQGGVLVDVRSKGEFEQGHIEGAINLPLGELESRVAEVGEQDRPVVLYCRSGSRSAFGVRILRGKGFTNLHNLGPMHRWG